MAVRLAEEADVPALLEIYAPYVLNTTCSFEYTVPDAREFLHRFQEITARFPWLVWEENGQILGYAYGSAPFSRAAYRWCCEASVYLHPDARRRGIGRALYGALEAIFRQLGYQKIYAVITDENTGSLAFHAAMGYTQAAHLAGCGYKFSRQLGTVWMEKDLPSSHPFASAPLAFPALIPG